MWYGDLIDTTFFDQAGQDLYLRLPRSELPGMYACVLLIYISYSFTAYVILSIYDAWIWVFILLLLL